MRPPPTIRLLLVAFLDLLLFTRQVALVNRRAPAAPTPPMYLLFHPQFIKNGSRRLVDPVSAEPSDLGSPPLSFELSQSMRSSP